MRRRSLLAMGALSTLRPAVGRSSGPLTLPMADDGAVFDRRYFGIHVHNNDPERNWPDIGTGSIRLWDAGVAWSSIERERGRFDFRRLDEYINWAASTGTEVLLPLGVTPRWASARRFEAGAYGVGTAAEPFDPDAWRQYVRTIARRYAGRIAAYQVLNEANEKAFFSGSADALIAMIEAAAREIREADPSAIVVAPSAVGLDDRILWPSRWLRAGAAPWVDAVAFHLYHSRQAPESMVDPVLRLQAANVDTGVSKPIWNTESGYWMPNKDVKWSEDETLNRVSEEIVAIYLPRDLIIARALGVQRFFWYAWDGSKMGLIDPVTRRHRPPALVYRQSIAALVGCGLRSCVRSADGAWTVSLVDGAGTALLALWHESDASASLDRWSIPLVPGTRALTLDGQSGWGPASRGIRVGPRVVLLSIPRP